MACITAQLQRVAQVLTLVVEHGSLPLESVCMLLQSSATMNAVLQQARGRCILGCSVAEAGPPEKLTSSCAWLVKHPGLVSGLALDVAGCCQAEAWSAVATALQACACRRVLLGQEGTPQPRLRLDAVSFGGSPPAAVLKALASNQVPILSLPSLERGYNVSSWDRDSWPSAAVCSALQTLTCLQRLYVASSVMPISFAQALHPLTALTYLHAHLQPAGAEFLPASLVELCLTTKQQVPQGTVLQLGHLTNLTGLRWAAQSLGRRRRHFSSCYADSDSEEEGEILGDPGAPVARLQLLPAVLPPRLNFLRVQGGLDLQSPCYVQQAEVLASSVYELGILQRLAASPEPWALQVCYDGDKSFDTIEPMKALHTAAAALASSKHLTRLKLLEDMQSESAGLAHWCEAIAQLGALQELDLGARGLQSGQLLQLSVLKSLRVLRLGDRTRVDDFTAVSLLPQLAGLESLVVSCRQMQTVAVFGAVSSLTNLTHLELSGWYSRPDLQDCHIECLLPLRKLQSLVVAGDLRRRVSGLCRAALTAQLTGLTQLLL